MKNICEFNSRLQEDRAFYEMLNRHLENALHEFSKKHGYDTGCIDLDSVTGGSRASYEAAKQALLEKVRQNGGDSKLLDESRELLINGS